MKKLFNPRLLFSSIITNFSRINFVWLVIVGLYLGLGVAYEEPSASIRKYEK
jgi:hypothetical protein